MSDVITQAKAAISEDSIEKLIELLSNDEASTVISQSNIIDSELGDNPLHFAARQKAQHCTKLLVNQPYNWNPDVSNHASLTPIHLSFQEADIATAYQLVLHSKQQIYAKFDETLAQRLLFYPGQHDDVATDNIIQCIFYSDTTGKPLSFTYLLFELLLSEKYSLAGRLLRTYIREPGDSHKNDHHNKVVTGILKLWAVTRGKPDIYVDELHGRIKAACDDGKYKGEDDQETTVLKTIDPLKLKDNCRIRIRAQAVTYLRNVGRSDGQRLNYATWLTKLPIPNGCQLFLLYNDMWPNTTVSRRAKLRELIELMF